MHEELLQYLSIAHEEGVAVDFSIRSLQQMPEAEREAFITKLVNIQLAHLPAEAKDREGDLRDTLNRFYRIGAGLEEGSLDELVESFNQSQLDH